MELDKDTLTNNINSEIEDAICLDVDSINDEIDDIFGDMYLESIS
jgi:tetrahydromethanopterin S-methyltransferase subunit B